MHPYPTRCDVPVHMNAIMPFHVYNIHNSWTIIFSYNIIYTIKKFMLIHKLSIKPHDFHTNNMLFYFNNTLKIVHMDNLKISLIIQLRDVQKQSRNFGSGLSRNSLEIQPQIVRKQSKKSSIRPQFFGIEMHGHSGPQLPQPFEWIFGKD